MSQNFTVRIKLSITMGFGDKVMEGVQNAGITQMVVNQTQGAGHVVSQAHEWDSGMFSHDLYLAYYITIDTKQAVLNSTHRIIGAIVNWAKLDKFAVKNKLS